MKNFMVVDYLNLIICENKHMSLSKLESTSSEITLAFNQSKFIELATKMRNEGKIKTDPEFAEKFMFAFENSPETFCVDLELLTEYKVYDKKGNAKRALTKNFTEGTDYQIEINCLSPERSGNQKASRGGNNKEIIMLTTECFKSMCVIAGSDAGKTVRQYYLDLEKISKACILDDFKESERLRLESDRLRLKAEKLHAQNVQRHKYFKFGKKGPVFYIIVSGVEPADGITRIKVGVVGCSNPKPRKCKNCGHKPQVKTSQPSIDSRLAEHRTLWPQLQVRFVVYTPNAQLLERNIKCVYKNKINPKGHEIIEGVKVEDLIETTNNYLSKFDTLENEPSFFIEENLELYNQQAMIPILNAIHELKEFVEEKMIEQKAEFKEAIKDANVELAKSLLSSIDKCLLKKLKDICQEQGVSIKGNKPEIYQRLKDHLSNIISKGC